MTWQLFLPGNFPDKPVRLTGVAISGWNDVQPVQPDLFAAPVQHEDKQRVLNTIDDVTEKFGKGLLQVGVPHRTP